MLRFSKVPEVERYEEIIRWKVLAPPKILLGHLVNSNRKRPFWTPAPDLCKYFGINKSSFPDLRLSEAKSLFQHLFAAKIQFAGKHEQQQRAELGEIVRFLEVRKDTIRLAQSVNRLIFHAVEGAKSYGGKNMDWEVLHHGEVAGTLICAQAATMIKVGLWKLSDELRILINLQPIDLPLFQLNQIKDLLRYMLPNHIKIDPVFDSRRQLEAMKEHLPPGRARRRKLIHTWLKRNTFGETC